MAAKNIVVIGGGPAGLAFATFWKRRHGADRVHVVEQNAPDATFGFGVVFSDRALDFLRASDPPTHDLIAPALETWSGITLDHKGERIEIDGIGFTAVGRLRLLKLMRERAASVGVDVRYNTAMPPEHGALDAADLVVVADGVNSAHRNAAADAFGCTMELSTNRFAWFGTTKRFETLTQTFVHSDLGTFNAHHYRYAPDMSTFIVECGAATFARAGFAGKTEDETKAICERVFTATLDGHPLLANRSIWRQFPHICCERWSHGNRVLMGDALRTAHFSIGSGTRLAIEDAIALADALDEANGEVDAGLALYQAKRNPPVEKLVKAARASARWYDDFATHMQLSPRDFAMSYIQRTGRVDPARLAQLSPQFAAKFAG